MSVDHFTKIFSSEVSDLLFESNSLHSLLSNVAALIREQIEPTHCVIFPLRDGFEMAEPLLSSREDTIVYNRENIFSISRHLLKHLARYPSACELVLENVVGQSLLKEVRLEIDSLKISSILARSVVFRNSLSAVIVIFQANNPRFWRVNERRNFAIISRNFARAARLINLEVRLVENQSNSKDNSRDSRNVRLAAHYEVLKEFSRGTTLESIASKFFEILRDEFQIRRLWLAQLNETGTRLLGQFAFGVGFKKKLVELNVELSGVLHPLASVVATGKASVIDNPQHLFAEYGVEKIFAHLKVRQLILIPMISAGQVLGILAVEPENLNFSKDEESFAELKELANDIANIILTEKLERNQAEGRRMESVGLLAASIAHNFNNILQVISGQASLIEISACENHHHLDSAVSIKESAKRGSALVEQLLAFSALEDPIKEMCDVNELIERNATSLAHTLSEGQELYLKLDKSMEKALVNPKQILSILFHILSNAREAMGAKGLVEIFTTRLEVTSSKPYFDFPAGKYLRIGVRDSGVGMDEKTRLRCFEPFFTTKEIDASSGVGLSGRGLGLSAAYALALRNGGRLVVESRSGKGSLFTLFLELDRPMKLADQIEKTVQIEKNVTQDKPRVGEDVDVFSR